MVLSTWKIWKWRWKKWCTIATGLAPGKALGTQLLAKPKCPKLARLWPAGSQDPELSALPCERIFPADASRGTFTPSAARLGSARGLSRLSHQLRGIQGSHEGRGSPLGTTHGAYVYSDHTGSERARKRACKTTACRNIRFIQWLVRMRFFTFLKELFSTSSAAISQVQLSRIPTPWAALPPLSPCTEFPPIFRLPCSTHSPSTFCFWFSRSALIPTVVLP